MVRKHRIWYPGARYHITTRGIRRTALFLEDEDRHEYLRLLKDAQQRMPFVLQAYCLMTNHIHLQLETIDHPPGRIIHRVHTLYASYFNNKYDYSGHVFESRYQSELLDSVRYELEVNRYIHLNPIRAEIVNDLNDYQWSSYLVYAGQRPQSMVSTDHIFTFIPNPKVENYLQFLYAKLKDIEKYAMIE